MTSLQPGSSADEPPKPPASPSSAQPSAVNAPSGAARAKEPLEVVQLAIGITAALLASISFVIANRENFFTWQVIIPVSMAIALLAGFAFPGARKNSTARISLILAAAALLAIGIIPPIVQKAATASSPSADPSAATHPTPTGSPSAPSVGPSPTPSDTYSPGPQPGGSKSNTASTSPSQTKAVDAPAPNPIAAVDANDSSCQPNSNCIAVKKVGWIDIDEPALTDMPEGHSGSYYDFKVFSVTTKNENGVVATTPYFERYDDATKAVVTTKDRCNANASGVSYGPRNPQALTTGTNYLWIESKGNAEAKEGRQEFNNNNLDLHGSCVAITPVSEKKIVVKLVSREVI